MVGVGHGLEAGDEAGQLVVSWRTGEEAAVHGDTPDHGLVVRVKTSSSETQILVRQMKLHWKTYFAF